MPTLPELKLELEKLQLVMDQQGNIMRTIQVIQASIMRLDKEMQYQIEQSFKSSNKFHDTAIFMENRSRQQDKRLDDLEQENLRGDDRDMLPKNDS
jgi:hypothetical protein